MYKCKMTAYEGDKPYIFISYAHKDSEKVFPILDLLSDRGYRVWYDDGIAPGSEWPEYIAEHLNGCEVTLAFVSANSVASPNCRREINFALSKNKSFVAVMLEKTEMSLGMELQLSSQQCVFRENFASDDAFVDKLCLMRELEQCKEEVKEEEDTKIRVANLELETKAPEYTAPIEKEPEKPVTPMETAEVKSENPPKVKTASDKKPSGKKIPVILGAIGGGIVAVILLIVIINAANHVTICGDKYSKSETYVYLSKITVTDSELSKLKKLKKLRHLEINDCEVDGDLSVLKDNTDFTDLLIENSTGISDYSFLTELPGLTRLELVNCGVSGELTLAGQSIVKLTVSDNPDFTGISNADISKLERLELSNTSVSSVDEYAACTDLYAIYAENTKVTDINALADLRNLDTIDFAGCDLDPVTDEFMSISLTELNLSDTGITDLSAFGYLTVLEYIGLSNNGLTEIPFLEKTIASVDELYVGGNNLSEETLNTISKCFNLEKIDISDAALTDLSILSKMDNIEEVRAEDCGLESLKGLEGKNHLQYIYVSGNRLTGVSDLKTAMADSAYRIADFRNNDITDLTGLPDGNYLLLLLNENDVDLATLPENVEGSNISFDYSDSVVNVAAAISNKFYDFFVIDVPKDKELSLGEAISDYKLYCVDNAYIDEQLKLYGTDAYDWEK